MLEFPPQLPSAKDYLPDWSTRRFVVFDHSGRWTSAVSAEVAQRLAALKHQKANATVFEACDSARDVLLLSELRSTIGVVLFLSGLERECLGVLSRLAKQPRHRPILIIAERRHRDLLPVLLEAGSDTVLFDIKDDIPIADWCLRCL